MLGGGVAFDGGYLVDDGSPIDVVTVHDGIECGLAAVVAAAAFVAVGCIASVKQSKCVFIIAVIQKFLLI